MNITAKLNDYRQSPRKVRLVANLIKGKSATEAVSILMFTVKKASDPLMMLLKSAIANAKNNFSLQAADLFVRSLSVDNGAILYRRMPRARGMAYAIRKRTSHITLILDTKTENAEVKKIAKADTVKKAKTTKVAKSK